MSEVAEVTLKQLRDRHGFTPIAERNGVPIFDSIPDGEYLIETGGSERVVVVKDMKFDFSRVDEAIA